MLAVVALGFASAAVSAGECPLGCHASSHSCW